MSNKVEIIDIDGSTDEAYRYSTPLKRKQAMKPLSDDDEDKCIYCGKLFCLINHEDDDIVPFSDVEDDDIVPLIPPPLVKRARTKLVPLDDELVQIDPLELPPVAAPKGQGYKVQRWCVTWNNPDKDGDDVANRLDLDEKVKGYAFQLEKGESGTPHFQMYLEFKNAQYMSGVKKSVGNNTIHCEKAMADKKANLKYCTKDDDRLAGPWIKGTCESEKGQGKRTDQDKFAIDLLAAGKITDELVEKYPGMMVKYHNHAKTLLAAEKTRKAKAEDEAYWLEQLANKKAGRAYGQQPRKLTLFFGPSAVGKTTEAMMIAIDTYGEMPYKKSGHNQWWCEYEAQKCVIIDEWRKDFTKNIETFNDMTNLGAYRGEVKGGQAAITAKEMMFTTNRHPMHIYGTSWEDPRYRAMVRRFHTVNWWHKDENGENKLTVLINPQYWQTLFDEIDPDESVANERLWNSFWRFGNRKCEEGDSVIIGEEMDYFNWGFL